MSSASSWFLLSLFVALCAVVLTVITKGAAASNAASPVVGSESFEEPSPYTEEKARSEPPPAGNAPPSLDELTPEMLPDAPLTTPGALRAGAGPIQDGELVMRPSSNPDVHGTEPGAPSVAPEQGVMEQDMDAVDGIEPFAGEEYNPW